MKVKVKLIITRHQEYEFEMDVNTDSVTNEETLDEYVSEHALKEAMGYDPDVDEIEIEEIYVS